MDTADSSKHSDIIISFEAKFDIVFNKKHLLIEALDHTALNSDRKKQYAVAGDSLLDFILFDYLICKKGYSRGKMDCIRRHLNTDATLAEIGRGIGLKEFIVFPISSTDQEQENASAARARAPRARQNVLFELGFFIGKLSRKNVHVFLKGALEWPSDYKGVLHNSFNRENWDRKLCRELKNAGFNVDANDLE